MAAKKKQDEENLKALREMVALPHNKHCFDCNQRGPTYINMTIGSFICTSCSGLLRGLNPPHRVKSISMASFTAEEMDFIKSRGNSFCQKVWLGLHDMRSLPSVDARDEVKMREMMTQRYEKKRWYVQPSDAMYEEARKQNASVVVTTSKQAVSARPTIASVQTEAAPVVTQLIQRPSVSSSVVQPSVGGDSFLMRAPSSDSQSQLPSSLGVPAKVDLLADFGGDPFAGSAMPNKSGDDTDGFANFASFSNQSSIASVSQPSGSMPKSPAFFANFSSSTTSSSVAPPVPADKYSALADLESAFMAPAPSSSTVNWDSTMGGGSLSSGVSAGSGTSSWGASGSSMFNGMGGLPASSNAFYGGSMATAPISSTLYNAAGGGGVPPAYAVSVNPFGQQPQLASHGQAVANPFVTGFGPVTSISSVGHFGVAPASLNNQIGMMNGQPLSMQHTAALAQVPPQQFNAAWGQPTAATAAWGQPAAGNTAWGQPTTVSAAWGQPAAVNPFMSNVPARSANVTNPFL